MKNLFSSLTFVIASLLYQYSYSQDSSERTNFVIIFLDDMGYGDLEVTGVRGYETPNITKLTSEGMLFTDFYAAQPISSASRAGLLTGCYPNRIGIHQALNPNSKIGISSEEETIAEVLKKKDYATAIFGKWHLGDSEIFLPLQHGFDEFYGIPYSNDMWPINGKWWPDLYLMSGNKKEELVSTNKKQEEFTTIFTEKSVDFIKRNKDNPFFLYLAHPMPHVPLNVSDKFKGKSEQGKYGDVMMEIDWSVGQIMKALEENGLYENTLLIFTSDNGPWLNFGNHAGSAGGLREGKGTSYDGGLKVPCVMRWPGNIPSGKVCNKLASTIDILPTIANIAEIELCGNKIDGVNILPLIKGVDIDSPRKEFYYYYKENDLQAVRNEKYKLILPHNGRRYEDYLPGKDGKPGPSNENYPIKQALYDLSRDPGERYDVQEIYPEIVEELMKIAEKARNDLGDNITGNLGKNRRPVGRILE